MPPPLSHLVATLISVGPLIQAPLSLLVPFQSPLSNMYLLYSLAGTGAHSLTVWPGFGTSISSHNLQMTINIYAPHPTAGSQEQVARGSINMHVEGLSNSNNVMIVRPLSGRLTFSTSTLPLHCCSCSLLISSCCQPLQTSSTPCQHMPCSHCLHFTSRISSGLQLLAYFSDERLHMHLKLGPNLQLLVGAYDH